MDKKMEKSKEENYQVVSHILEESTNDYGREKKKSFVLIMMKEEMGLAIEGYWERNGFCN